MPCTHPLRINTLCCDCGADIKDDKKLFQVLHNNKDIKLTEQEALARDQACIGT
ncbi:hypothetical protein NAPIS_ORF00359 [Vairimorpha apis BRL 01]|uniref:Uncharacterized protein n=1 Tax=Vairimorpha apis BRL 01 TaxID=1037528 RepID=T0LCN1_9MICR|nr:hypothetical protein NAPIS_ORF00359 [Vairimorpha apis BRL 01]